MSALRPLRGFLQSKSSVCLHCRRALSLSATQQKASAVDELMSAFTRSKEAPPSRLVRQQQPRQASARTPEQFESSLTSVSPPRPRADNRALMKLYGDEISQDDQLAQNEKESRRQDIEAQMSRRWREGEVYAPHDLSAVEGQKWKQLRRKQKQPWDVVDLLGINPLNHYKNFSIMSEYMTEMGRIKHNKDTTLRPVNQRKMAKAIRRAVALGLMPGTYRHPEIVVRERKESQKNRSLMI